MSHAKWLKKTFQPLLVELCIANALIQAMDSVIIAVVQQDLKGILISSMVVMVIIIFAQFCFVIGIFVVTMCLQIDWALFQILMSAFQHLAKEPA